jgi:hypothetical protein
MASPIGLDCARVDNKQLVDRFQEGFHNLSWQRIPNRESESDRTGVLKGMIEV